MRKRPWLWKRFTAPYSPERPAHHDLHSSLERAARAPIHLGDDGHHDRGAGIQLAQDRVAALTILGMAACYGVVCGAMMFAGEQEGGTLVFLDIFLGRRGLLWMGKFA